MNEHLFDLIFLLYTKKTLVAYNLFINTLYWAYMLFVAIGTVENAKIYLYFTRASDG